jgi:hypothetical protein
MPKNGSNEAGDPDVTGNAESPMKDEPGEGVRGVEPSELTENASYASPFMVKIDSRDFSYCVKNTLSEHSRAR